MLDQQEHAALGASSTPVLMVQGSDTKPMLTRSARHVVDHVPDATVRRLPGTGHAAPLTHPEVLADALIEFLSPARQPA